MDWAHLFGRRQIISEPWCSSPELTAALCRPCHQSIDRGLAPYLQKGLRLRAIHSLCEATGATPPVWCMDDPLGAMRVVVSESHV